MNNLDRHLLLVLLGLVTACGGGASSDAGATGGGDAARDATSADTASDAGSACDALTPRTPAAEAFVGPEGLRMRLVNLFDGARTSLDATSYLLDDNALIQALAGASERGVRVRVLLDPDQAVNTGSSAQLRARGVDVRFASRMFEHFHSKTLVIDGELGVVMSANLNGYSMQSERNHGVLLRDPEDVADLAALFELDFNDGGAAPELSCTRLVYAPNNARSRMEALVESARTTLEVQHLSFSDVAMRNALMARAAAGVGVRVLLADPDWITGNASAASALRGAGLEVRFLRSLDNHAKLLLVDGSVAMIGSENLSSTSLDHNREVGVLVTDAAAYATFRDAFESDWSISTE